MTALSKWTSRDYGGRVFVMYGMSGMPGQRALPHAWVSGRCTLTSMILDSMARWFPPALALSRASMLPIWDLDLVPWAGTAYSRRAQGRLALEPAVARPSTEAPPGQQKCTENSSYLCTLVNGNTTHPEAAEVTSP